MLAAQVASRTWVMRTRDLEAWKKETEFCVVLVVLNCRVGRPLQGVDIP
jgi:hypothetical protein